MIKTNILITDDADGLRRLLKRVISLEGYIVYEAPDLRTAEKILSKAEIDVIVSDVRLPDGSGLDFTRAVKVRYPAVEVILLTAFAQVSDAVEAMRSVAFDYISKGEDDEKLLPLIDGAIEKSLLQRRAKKREARRTHTLNFGGKVGQVDIWLQAKEIASKGALLDGTVMLRGETGTGKELFARAIHAGSRRSAHPFVTLNCGALPDGLLERELFGYKTGSLANAMKDKRGLIEEANGGTLFLDEIEAMPAGLQAMLLRMLETGQYYKVGGSTSLEMDVRILSATNGSIQKEMSDGKFREDLFYRLNMFSIDIPPLRDRDKDISLLAEHFIQLFADRMNRKLEGMDKEFLLTVESWPWKGNVRELRNVIERAVILENGKLLSRNSLPLELLTKGHQPQYIPAFDLASIEKLHIQRVLDYTRGNKVEAARLLNIGLTTVYRKIEEYGLD